MATLSLGSHAVFHYYRYKNDDEAPSVVEASSTSATNGTGRTIDPTPVASVFLERRSLIITTGDLYVGHLHGIEEVHADRFPAHLPDAATAEQAQNPIIRNLALLGDDTMRNLIQRGDTLDRGVRYSLTCRDVERVIGATLSIKRR